MESGHCLNYRIFKKELCLEKYLLNLNPKSAATLCRFRCGNHSLPNVTGRHSGIDIVNRKCTLCKSYNIGDEFHYIFQCDAFSSERSSLISGHITPRPCALTLEALFSTNDPLALSNLSKFCAIIMAKFRPEWKLTSKRKLRQKKKKGTTVPN